MTILLLNQYYAPDVAATAQIAADWSRAMAAQGHSVTVVTSRRSSNGTQSKFPSQEVLDGVRVIRVATTGFGKASRWRRATNFASFLLACAWRMLCLPRYDVVLAMTTPPLVSVLAALVTRLKGGALQVWLMDMNPDEAIVAGWLRPDCLAARVLETLHRYSLRRAERVIVLDRFMKRRLEGKGIPPNRIEIVPPWSHDVVRWDPAGRAAFRREHGLEGKFVVMYSGNHSPCHPLESLLEAAACLRDQPDVAFCFVGGGSEFSKVQAFARGQALQHFVCLPYQPLARLSASLSAADLHVVVMGDPFVGIVHPSKIYNVMALGLPVLFIGPAESHVTDLGTPEWLYSIRNGDVAGIARHILEARKRGRRRYQDESTLAENFAQSVLLARLAEGVAGAVHAPVADDEFALG